MTKRTLHHRQRGVALIEFALILPLLLILSILTFEFGRALYQYNTVVKSVRDAVRYLSVQTPGTKKTEAKKLVVYGKVDGVAGTDQALTIGLSESLVPDPTWQLEGTAPAINTVTVSVTGYQFTPLMNNFFGLSIGVVNFAPISATMRAPL